MDRETRKANLKKLQLPGTAEGGTRQQRKSRKNSITTTGTTTTISNYFLTPEKKKSIKIKIDDPQKSSENHLETKDHHNGIDNTDKAILPVKTSRLKRTKLDTFVFKDPQNIPNKIKNCNKPLNTDDDLVVPEKKLKKAPKLPCSSEPQTKRGKPSKTKKQTTIKSAFLRNEQIFAEIAAQHCAADQFDGDDVQLALAISKSEADSKGIHNDSEDVVDLVDSNKDPELLIEKLKKYGFRTAEKKDYNTFTAAFLPKANGRRTKSKWANKFTPLTLRNPDTQNKKLQDNIKYLLNEQQRFEQLIDDEQLQTNYNLKSYLLKKCDMENEETIIHKEDLTNTTLHQYFVLELFEANELRAGHLLKDWSAIQGRDLTPTTKSQPSREKSIMLDNIYRELEDFFCSRKILDFTITNQTKEEKGELQVVMEVTEDNIDYTADKNNLKQNYSDSDDVKTPNATRIQKEKSELDKMIASIEVFNENECSVRNSSWEKLKNILPPVKSLDMMNVSVDSKSVEQKNKSFEVQNNNTSSYKIKSILPSIKSLDKMQVSKCSKTTEATFNILKNNRSNSPDLFADSDIEIEEEIYDTDSKVENVQSSKMDNSNRCLNDINGTTTYEIYSSDEVKNTSPTIHNNQSSKNETPMREQSSYGNNIIDLTQDDLEMQLSASKAISDIDLFAESPLQEDHELEPQILDQATKEDTSKFTLSLQSTVNEQEITDEKNIVTIDDTMKFIHNSMETKQCDEDVVLPEIAMSPTNTSFFNFEGRKQLESYFHKETDVGKTEFLKDSFNSNDSIFRELCNKYLDDVSEYHIPFVNNSDNYLGKSFTQPLAHVKTLKHVTDISLDFQMNMENVKAYRKSNSFNTKSPKNSKDENDFILCKSHSFNDKSDISIDLTRNEDDDDVIPEEDDDYLILSDDEINYSIWQANKTGDFKTCDMSDNEDDAINIPENCFNNEEEGKNLIEEAILDFPNKYPVDFDYMDLLEKESSSLNPKDTCSSLELLLTSKSEEFNVDRTEFGILEEHSEPVDYTTTLCTPTKHLNNASFLSSPSEKTAPMKRYSNCQMSSQKFNDLLKSLDKQSNDFQNFDEFDHLVYHSPSKKTIPNCSKPEGLEQLLTAEITFCKSPLPKTPVKATEDAPQEFNYNNKTYTIRNITSPKPDYTQYPESELLKKLYNFGIKPLKRKQAVKILEYIYNQTHPILLDDDVNKKPQGNIINLDDEPMMDVPSTSKSYIKSLGKTSLVSEQIFSSRISDIVNKTFESCSSLSSQNAVKTKDIIKSLVSSQRTVKETVEDVCNKLVLKDACGMEMLRYSIDFKAELVDENFILQTNVTKKTSQPLLPFHIAWYNLVCSNHKLHETILMYEPLDLQQIYLFLKGLGYRYDPKDLKIFFDRRCIIFRYDIAAAGSSGKTTDKNRHIRKKRKPQTIKLLQ